MKSFPHILRLWLVVTCFIATSFSTPDRNSPVETAQSKSRSFVKVLDITVEAGTTYSDVNVGMPYSALVCEFPSKSDLSLTQFNNQKGDSFPLYIITGHDPDEPLRSPLFISDSLSMKFSLKTGNFAGKFRLYLIGAPQIKIDKKRYLDKGNLNCQKPDYVESYVWREGLADPIPGRSKHIVKHCIVHHSASSNTAEDYVNAVRNIYLYHTEVNGWDDVGYNYLISADGTLFQGRDDLGLGEEDNIKGAHFCGKNSGTMGVCLIGNFMETKPTDSSLATLRKLLSWKCFKSNIDASGQSRHPDMSSPLLSHIGGHRDGCATACPGDSAYPLIERIRETVSMNVDTCKLSLNVNDLMKKSIEIYPNPTHGDLYLRTSFKTKSWTADLFKLDGSKIRRASIVNNHIHLDKSIPSGLYFLRLMDPNASIHVLRRVMISQEP